MQTTNKIQFPFPNKQVNTRSQLCIEQYLCQEHQLAALYAGSAPLIADLARDLHIKAKMNFRDECTSNFSSVRNAHVNANK